MFLHICHLENNFPSYDLFDEKSFEKANLNKNNKTTENNKIIYIFL
jgi:hypothetical protein